MQINLTGHHVDVNL